MSIETMTKLATVTVGSGGSANIEFTNIPQTYTDLVIKASARSDRNTGNASDVTLQFNATATTYTIRGLYGDGSSAASNIPAYIGAIPQATDTASTFGNLETYIPNYASSNQKSFSTDAVEESNVTNPVYAFLTAGLWNGTSAISSIKLSLLSGNFVQYSTATLYGIKNARKTAGNSIKATGGNISFDGTYVVHTFNSSGTFTPSQALTADYLVVAGGGSGGNSDVNNVAGGGGAGGYRSSLSGGSALSLTAQAYTVTVGAGGAQMLTDGANGNNGSDSVFASIRSSGGGGGGGSPAATGTQPGSNGGSGGGGGDTYTGNQLGGSGNLGGYSPVEGYAGGNCAASSAGGGGGASAAGANGSGASSYVGGNGGAGSANSITGFSVTYAGGGGGGAETTGGAGGAGGGGTGGQNSGGVGRIGTAGTVNTGGGGGGARASGSGGPNNGGSGVVIIRYKA